MLCRIVYVRKPCFRIPGPIFNVYTRREILNRCRAFQGSLPSIVARIIGDKLHAAREVATARHPRIAELTRWRSKHEWNGSTRTRQRACHRRTGKIQLWEDLLEETFGGSSPWFCSPEKLVYSNELQNRVCRRQTG